MHRDLGSFETALTLTGRHAPFVVVVVLHLSPGPPRERLRLALEVLQQRHPMLGVRICERAGHLLFTSEGTPEIPLRWVEGAAEGAWRRVAEEELNLPIDEETGPLLRATWLASAAGAESATGHLLLTFHHTALDGVSGAALIGELLHLCGSDAAAPELAGLPPSALPPPLESLLPPAARGLAGAGRRLGFLARQLVDEIAYRLRTRGEREPPIEETTRCRVLTVELSAAATTALVRRARRERVTLPAALSAAFLLAAHRYLYGGRKRPLRHILFANLRPQLRPPLPEMPLGSYISMLRYTVKLSPRRAFWPLAGSITRQVGTSLHRGEKFSAARLCEPMMRRALGQRSERMAATAVSYSGPIRFGACYGSIGLEGVHAFVSNFALGPEYTAQVKMFRGRLQLDVVYLDVDMGAELAEAIAAEILETLQLPTATE
jgi:hypothetical protein